MSWFSITHEGDTAFCRIGDDLGCHGPTAADFLAALDDAQRVELHIDSHGGCSRTALEIVDALKGRESVCIIERALSSAAIVAQGCRHRQIYADAKMMLHASQDHVCGNARELRQTATRLDGIQKKQIQLLVARTGQTTKTVHRWMSGPDHWFTASEAIAAGLADDVIERPKTLAQRLAAKGITPPPGPTEEEQLFDALLRGFPRLEVRDRQQFLERLQMWAASAVR